MCTFLMADTRWRTNIIIYKAIHFKLENIIFSITPFKTYWLKSEISKYIFQYEVFKWRVQNEER